MLLGSIDVGTNSVKLLVADVQDGGIREVLIEQLAITRLGQGLDKIGRILPEAMDRTIEAIAEFKSRAYSEGARDLIVVATSAVRDANNRDEFKDKLKSQLGLDLWVLSGEEEAELTFTGTCSDPNFRSKRLMLVDVGGGSTEFIIGENSVVQEKFSVNVGCVRFTEKFIKTDPIDHSDFQTLIQNLVSSLFSPLSKVSLGDRKLVGVGGTITTLAAIHQNLNNYGVNQIHGYVLQKQDVAKLLAYLRRMTLAERQKVPGLDPKRADIIVTGAAIFSTILEILRCNEITISTRGVRYGALIKAFMSGSKQIKGGN